MSLLSSAQARLQDDLRGLVSGDVRCDRVTLSLYSTDASLFELRPVGVVWPRTTEDVVACVQYAAEKRIPIHARGAGTGTAGGAIGRGIILDFTRYMRRLIRFGDDSLTVQPGANRLRVNAILAQKQDRLYGPDPGFTPTATFGGIIASDGAGPRWSRYGSPRDTLLGMTVVLADGEILRLKHDTLPAASEDAVNDLERRFVDPRRSGTPEADYLSPADESMARKVALARGIVHGRGHQFADDLYRIISTASREGFEEHRGIPVDNCGYRLDGVIQKAKRNVRVNLLRLFAGSEGTLGIVTELRLRTAEQARHIGAAVLSFDSIEKAMRAVSAILPFQPALCELIDRRRIALLVEWDRRFAELIPPNTEAALLVELDGRHPLDLTDRLNEMVLVLRHEEFRCFDSRLLLGPDDRRLFLELLEKSAVTLFRMKKTAVATPILDDMAVGCESLPSIVHAIQNIFKSNEAVVSFSGHVGHGHLCLQPILDRQTPDLPTKLKRIVEEVNDEVIRCGGTLVSEQVGGLARSRYVSKQAPTLYPVFVKIKNLFDPDRILNPGKVVTDGLPWTSCLRPSFRTRHETDDFPSFYGNAANHSAIRLPGESGNPPDTACMDVQTFPADVENDETAQTLASQLELQLKWVPDRFTETTLRCNGCGRCRSRLENARMCPMFRVLGDESAAPRSKANLMCDVLGKKLSLDTLISESSKRVADTCIHCHACRIECPSEVDISQLAFRCKAAYVAAHGMSLGDRLLSNLDPVCRILTLLSCPVSWSLKNKVTRWVYDKLFGIPQGRKLPDLVKVSFLTKAQWTKRLAKPTRDPGPKVALFVDTFGNLFDTKLPDAAVKILQHNGIGVYVPPRQRTAGDNAFACGDQYHAEILARRNIAVFADAIRQGYDVVTLEPSSMLCLTHEYRYLTDDPDAELVAANTTDICTYLLRLARSGTLDLSFRPLELTVGYHAPCRTLATANATLETTTDAESLLRLIPDLNVRRLERGCCGMARNFGMNTDNYQTSLRIGMRLFKAFRDTQIGVGATECSSCKLQMENAVDKPVLHPIKLLASAYGL